MMIRFFSFWFFPLASLILVYVVVRSSNWDLFALLAAAGFGLWTLLEYFMHRFIFHGRSRHPRIRQLRKRIHLYHHGDPNNPERILVRPLYSVTISSLLLGLFYLLSGSFLASVPLLVGLWAGFLYYESVHYRVHLSASTGLLLGRQRRCHYLHHFVDGHRCYGVTSPLWDVVFGTYRPSERHSF